MKRVEPGDNGKLISFVAQLVARQNIANKLGLSFSGERNIYKALGYEEGELKFENFYTRYRRQDMAKALIDRPAKATWRGDVAINETSDDKETGLEKDFKELNKKLKLKSKFVRLDRLVGLGHYGILFLGFNDAKDDEGQMNPVTPGKRELLYVKPIGEKNAQIAEWEEDSSNERYGLPLFYDITTSSPGNTEKTKTIRVHYSRVLHVVEDLLESEVEGLPRLEAVFNRLQDLEKLVGGSAEMFWRGARPGYGAKLDKDFQMTTQVKEDLKNQIDEYEHDLRRMLILEGFDVSALTQTINDPEKHVDVQIKMLSAVTGIPNRILSGSERGELSSTQDKDEWDTWVKTRREEFAEAQIIRPFIDLLVEYKILTAPKEKNDYTVEWEDLFAPSERQKAEVGKTRAEAVAKYAGSPGAEMILPPEAFYKYCMGLDDDQIELIQQQVEAEVSEEEEMMAKVEEEIQKRTPPQAPVPPGQGSQLEPGQQQIEE